MPQPADWLLCLVMLIYIFKGYSFHFQYVPVQKLKFFLIYVFLVNFFWAFFIDQSMEKRFPSYFHTLFYIFNFLLFTFSIHLFSLYRLLFINVTVYAAGFSMIIQALISLTYGDVTARNSLFFNNPNQLGYYSLVAGTVFSYLTRVVSVPVVFQVFSYFAFLYLCLLSSSKAAMAGGVALVLLSAAGRGIISLRHILTLLIVGFAIYYFITSVDFGTRLFDYAFNRFYSIGQSRDDTIEGRGYDRILNEPGYMILGAGEGGYYRFKTLLSTGEIHSSFGTILFCYGMPGLLFFILFLRESFRYSSFLDALYFVPIVIYSFTHQGLRSSLFWVLIALFYCGSLILKTYRENRIITSKATQSFQ